MATSLNSLLSLGSLKCFDTFLIHLLSQQASGISGFYQQMSTFYHCGPILASGDLRGHKSDAKIGPDFIFDFFRYARAYERTGSYAPVHVTFISVNSALTFLVRGLNYHAQKTDVTSKVIRCF